LLRYEIKDYLLPPTLYTYDDELGYHVPVNPGDSMYDELAIKEFELKYTPIKLMCNKKDETIDRDGYLKIIGRISKLMNLVYYLNNIFVSERDIKINSTMMYK
jgi:hypothetical protein